MWDLDPWAPVGDGAAGPALLPVPPLVLWAEAGTAAISYPFDRLSRSNLRQECHAAAISLSVRPPGMGLPLLGNIPPSVPSPPCSHPGPRGSPWGRPQRPRVEVLHPLATASPSRTVPSHIGLGLVQYVVSAWDRTPEARV